MRMAFWYFKSASHTTTSAEGFYHGKRPNDSLEVIRLVNDSLGSNRLLLPKGCFLRNCSVYNTPCLGRQVLLSVRINTLTDFNAHDNLGSRSCDALKPWGTEGLTRGRARMWTWATRVSKASIFFHFSLVFCGGCSEVLPATSWIALCLKTGLLPHCLCVPIAANIIGAGYIFPRCRCF